SVLDRHLALVVGLRSAKGRTSDSHRFTFDDGHVSSFRFALPLLTRHAVTGIFFAIGSYIGNRPDYMTWEQLKELVSRGHEVQSHGWSHIPLTQCSGSKLTEEPVRSKQTLEDMLHVMVDAILSPDGRWNSTVIELLLMDGYMLVYYSC